MASIVALVVILLWVSETSASTAQWKKEMLESVQSNIQYCNWTEITIESVGHRDSIHANHLVKLLDSPEVAKITKNGFALVQILPREKDVEQFRKLPPTLTKAHAGFYAAASKRGYNVAWANNKESRWEIPVGHPGQNKENCHAQTKLASTGEITEYYAEWKSIERVSYVLRADNGYVHPTGAAGFACGYF